MSQICKSIIKLDEDGEYILDYLNDAIWKSSFQGDDGKLLRLAFDFIKAEKLRFETENNEKLALKYSYLYKYFVNTRKELH